MTEDEARTKWCPFTRLVTTNDGSVAVRTGAPTGYNRFSGAPKQLNTAASCIASACMAWRWEPVVNRAGEPSGHHKGHCGLVGPSVA